MHSNEMMRMYASVQSGSILPMMLGAVENVMKTMEKKQVWLCSSCYMDLGNSESIVCESCLDWFHLRCVTMKKPPRKKDWFCRGRYS